MLRTFLLDLQPGNTTIKHLDLHCRVFDHLDACWAIIGRMRALESLTIESQCPPPIPSVLNCFNGGTRCPCRCKRTFDVVASLRTSGSMCQHSNGLTVSTFHTHRLGHADRRWKLAAVTAREHEVSR
jgi:hypothetical protein